MAVKLSKTTGVEVISETPDRFVLEQNYPNPFNPSTNKICDSQVIAGETKQSQSVTLKVYDILGNEVAILSQ